MSFHDFLRMSTTLNKNEDNWASRLDSCWGLFPALSSCSWTHSPPRWHKTFSVHVLYEIPIKVCCILQIPHPERRIVSSALLWSESSSLPYYHWNLIAIQEVLRTGTFLKSRFNWHIIVRAYETQCYTLVQVCTMQCLDGAEGICITASIFLC